jgi:serine/threonine-protein kinase HipA
MSNGMTGVRRALAVWLDGAPGPIGTLISQGSGSANGGSLLHFAYDPTYLRHPQAVPVSASLPLRADVFPDAEARVFFDNLLPEGERRRNVALANRLDPADMAGLLEVLGRECPGAVSVLPRDAPPVKAPGRLDTDYETLTPASLDALVADAAVGRPAGTRARFSLAGVQEKLALARDPASGTFLLPRASAPTTWLLKVEPRRGTYRGIVANEALCLSVLRRLGLPVAHAERTVIAGLSVRPKKIH